MKRIRKLSFIAVLGIVAIIATSCFGSFGTVRKVYQWNESVTGSKFVNNLVFYGLNIVPIYPISSTLDLFIFNVIEFWTGANPMAMSEGEVDRQIIMHNGKFYALTATKNAISITEYNGDETKHLQTFNFNKDSGEIFVNYNDSEIIVATFE